MSFHRLKSDGTAAGTVLDAEERAVSGEELFWPQSTGTAGVVVTESTALQMPAFLAAVVAIATDVAVLPLDVYQKLGDDSRRTALEHPNTVLLTRSPNGETTPVQWKAAWMGHAIEFGNGYAEIQRTGRGKPYALHLLDPVTTRPRRINGELRYHLGDGRSLEPANVLHIAGLGFDGLSGYNVVHLTRQAIGLGIASASSAADYFENGSEPGGYIKVPNRLKDQQAVTRLRQGWEGQHGGLGKKHRVGILEENAEWVATTGDPEKSQLLQTRQFQVLDAIRATRVPPNKVGDFTHAHLRNVEAANLDYVMSALIGWLTVIEQQCNLKLFSTQEWRAGYYVEHNVNALLRGDAKTRFESYEIAIRNGWMSRDEVRKKENENPIGEALGGNLYTVQAQVVPLDKAGIAFALDAAQPTDTPATDTPAPEPAADAQN